MKRWTLRVSCGAWQQNIDSGSMAVEGVENGAIVHGSFTSHECSAGFGSGELSDQSYTLFNITLKTFLNCICGVIGHIILPYLTIGKWFCHWGNNLVCTNGLVNSTCQNNVLMTSKTQSFPAEHCIVAKQLLLFILLVSGFNVVADIAPIRSLCSTGNASLNTDLDNVWTIQNMV